MAEFPLRIEVVGMGRRLSARPRKAPLAIGFGAVIILVTGQAKSNQGFVQFQPLLIVIPDPYTFLGRA